ncbi:MAG TPA: hypothetical protein VEZ41_16180, partial [Allosphingosinicella sp.]|nr:hypothetical protein [Allosphingosinicella sp.]
SLATIVGRVAVTFRLCPYYHQYAEHPTASADLCYEHKSDTFFLHVVIQVEPPEKIAPGGVVGVDLGIVELATDSHGNAYSGAAVKTVRRQLRRIRSLLVG